MSKHWLLLRGLGRDHRHWGEFINQFKAAFADDKVSVLDTCGNGDFATLKSPLSIAKYTDHCRQHITEHSQGIHLVALSLGGMIALDWAQRFPQEVVSITLLNSSAANLTSWHKRINLSHLVKAVLAILASRQPEIIEKAILQLSSNQTQNNDTLARWTEYRREQCTSNVNLIRQLIAASRFKAFKLTNISPLVLTSKSDRLVNTIASEHLYFHLGGKLVVHPSAGHDLPLDDANWVIAQIKQYP